MSNERLFEDVLNETETYMRSQKIKSDHPMYDKIRVFLGKVDNLYSKISDAYQHGSFYHPRYLPDIMSPKDINEWAEITAELEILKNRSQKLWKKYQAKYC